MIIVFLIFVFFSHSKKRVFGCLFFKVLGFCFCMNV
jgi:hypothetical protein